MNPCRIAAAVALAGALGTAHAGRTCEARSPDAAAVAKSLALAERTARQLDASGATVVAIARAGQDLSRYGLHWSHMGWAYRDTQGVRSVWRVVHKLNQCGSDNASLYRQGLAEFFLDDPYQFQAGLVVPRPEVQSHLLPLLQHNANVARLHTPAYSMVAYPWAQQYQQSNQWAIEQLAWAEEPSADRRDRAQAWLRFKGYQPTVLHLSAVTRLGARMSSASVAFDDHPNKKRFADHIETVSVDSVFTWMERTGLGGRVQVVR
jgi:hypothetical protein